MPAEAVIPAPFDWLLYHREFESTGNFEHMTTFVKK